MLEQVFKSNVTKMVMVLTLVGVLSGASLVFVYNYSIPKIKINIETETKNAIKSIFPEADKITSSGIEGVSKVMDIDGRFIGYAVIADGNGYQGTIKLIFGMNSSLSKMQGLEVLESQETPGLGGEITNPKFKNQFKGLELTHAIEYVKGKKEQSYEIEAITGATISSAAIVKALNKRIKEVKKDLLEK